MREVLRVCSDAQHERTPSPHCTAGGEARSWDGERCDPWLEDFDELDDALLSETLGTFTDDEELFQSS